MAEQAHLKILPTKQKMAPGESYPKEYREWAFQLWAFEYSRNVSAVARRLISPEEDDPLPAINIDRSTVQYWSQQDKWPEELSKRFSELAPDMHESILQNLMFSSVEFSRYLRDMARGDVPLTNNVQINAARTMIEGSKVAFDRSGIMPWLLSSDRAKPVGPSRSYDVAIGQMETSELIERMNRRVQVRDTTVIDVEDQE